MNELTEESLRDMIVENLFTDEDIQQILGDHEFKEDFMKWYKNNFSEGEDSRPKLKEIFEKAEKLDKIEEVSNRFKFTPTYLIKKIINDEHVCNDTSCNSEDDHEKLDENLETIIAGNNNDK